MTKVENNDWIDLAVQFKGVTVQRKFAGLNTLLASDNKVEFCMLYYRQRELYPNGEAGKEELKSYSLQDLAYSEIMVKEGEVDVLKCMNALPVLTGFITALGTPAIINPSRQTLANATLLPFDAEHGYPLHRDTREKFIKEV